MRKMIGFTLVELMATVAVIAVILVIGVPSIANLKRSGDLTTTSQDLFSALSFARAEAIRRGENVEVGPNDTGGSWASGWNVGTNLGDADPTNWVIYRSFPAPSTGSSVALTTGTSPVTFAGLGNVSTASCFDLSVSGSSAVRSLPIALTGRVTTCRATCAVVNDPTDSDYDPSKCD
ncbi:MAG: GspH/FimT family pseudopilin [Chromatiaceae bacterium]|nr:GspH/FimT family pseudopilin [Chromatiaceae bacterium]